MLPEGAGQRLARAHVAVVGVGGVGSWTVEALARCGVGKLTLIDPDTVCASNINRQLPALRSTVGMEKIEVLASRVRDINPDVCVGLHPVFLTKNNADALLSPGFDYVVDAVDRMSVKALILARCREGQVPVVTMGGSGGRLDPSQIEVRDLGRSGGDELLRLVRRKLRRDHGWEGGDGNLYGVPAVFSREPMRIPGQAPCCPGQPDGVSLRMGCEGALGSAVFVTAAFGMFAAGVVVRELLQGVE